jgi:hypothetical protein
VEKTTKNKTIRNISDMTIKFQKYELEHKMGYHFTYKKACFLILDTGKKIRAENRGDKNTVGKLQLFNNFAARVA